MNKDIRNPSELSVGRFKCENCGLCGRNNPKFHINTNCMSGSGSMDAEVLFVLDCPNQSEDEYGRILIGKPAKLLESTLKRVGLDFEHVRVTYAVRCRPENKDKMSNDDMFVCKDHLLNEISAMPNLKLIVPLGAIPLHILTNKVGCKRKPQGITKLRGRVKQLPDLPVPIIPMLSPSAILRNPGNDANFRNDMQKIATFLVGGLEKKPVNYFSVYTLEDLAIFKESIKDATPTVFDLETTSKDTPYGTIILNISFSWQENTAVYLPINEHDDGNYWIREFGIDVWDELHAFLKKWFEDPNILKIAHNMKFDASYTEVILGIRPKGIYFDTMLAHYLLDNLTEHGLKPLADRYTDLGMYDEELDDILEKIRVERKLKKNEVHYGMVDVPIIREYALTDADATFRLYKIFKNSLDKSISKSVFYNILIPATRVVADSEIHGVGIDIELTKKLSDEFQAKLDAILAEVYVMYGKEINPNSAKQLRELLFGSKEDGGLGLPSIKLTKEDNDSTDKTVLTELAERYNIPVLNRIVEYKSLSTIRSTFLEGMLKSINPITGRIHPNYKLHGTVTGRLACIAKGSLVEVVRDVSKYPKGVPIEDVKSGELAYCFNDKLELTLSKIKWVGKTGNKKVIRVHWLSTSRHNRGYIDLTPEHRVRLISGEYVEAKDLKKSDRVMSLSRDYTLGYARLYASGIKKGFRDHRFIASCFNNIEDLHVHHIDGNKLNNNLCNLDIMTSSEHATLEFQVNKDERLSKISKTMKEQYANGERKPVMLCGEDNPGWLGLEKEWMEQVLWENAGQPTAFRDIHGIDYETAQKYMKMHNINYKDYSKFFSSKNELITKEIVEHSLVLKKEVGGQYKALKYLNTNFYRWKEQIKFYKDNDIPYKPNNHIITHIEELDGTVDVYDMEVENEHNFIVNEICVHNCQKPNLLNIPRDGAEEEYGGKIRNIFIPVQRTGTTRRRVFVDGDVSGAEFRLLGEISRDPAMAKLFADKVDIHRRVASIALGIPEDKITKLQRYNAKSLVFGLMYGRGTKSVAKFLKISENQAEKFKQTFFSLCPGAEKWIAEHVKKIKKEKFVTSIFGRVRMLPNIDSDDDFIATSALREGLNTPIQGAASDYVNIALISIYNELERRNIDAIPLIYVYDSIIVECWEDEAQEVYDIMEYYMTRKIAPVSHVPMEAEIAIVDRWSGKKIEVAA